MIVDPGAGFQQDFDKQNHFGNRLTEHSRKIVHDSMSIHEFTLTDSLDSLKFQYRFQKISDFGY